MRGVERRVPETPIDTGTGHTRFSLRLQTDRTDNKCACSDLVTYLFFVLFCFVPDKSAFHKRLLLFLLVPLLLAMLLPITKYLFDEETKVGSEPLSGPVVTDSHPGTSKFD